MMNVVDAAGLMTYANNYKQQQRDRLMAVVPQVALAATDVYAGAATSLLPEGGAMADALPIVAGAVAVGHGIYGLTQIWPRDTYYYPAHTKLELARGVGHLVTAAGFAALAFGLGAYALPIIGIGEVARVSATLIGREA